MTVEIPNIIEFTRSTLLFQDGAWLAPYYMADSFHAVAPETRRMDLESLHANASAIQ